MSDLPSMLAAGLWQRVGESVFLQHAFLGGAAVALACGVLSVFVVLKRMAFIGEGISHAAFGGLGAAFLAGLAVAAVRPPLARDGIVAAFCVATAVAIGWLSRRGRLSEDVAIGIVMVAAMAAGVVMLDLRANWLEQLTASGQLQRGDIGYAPGYHEILFGNIIFLGRTEVILAWVLAGLVAAGVAALFKELAFYAFDEETAEVFGVRTGMLYYGLLVALALAVVLAMRTVGVILVSALLILPGASARYWSGRIGRVTLISAALGLAGMIGGLALSLELNLSPGAVIVLTLTAIFLLSWLVSILRRKT